MGVIAKYCASDAKSALASNASQVILLLLITAFAAFYFFFWESYQDMKARNLETQPWSISCNIGDGDKASVQKMTREIQKIDPNAKVVACADSDIALVDSNDNENEIHAQLVHRNDAGLYPVDLFGTDKYVTEGDPRSGDGFILDLITAQQYGLHAGDICRIAYLGVGDDGKTPVREYCDMKISALVAPDDNFSGAALFRPQANIDIAQIDSNEFATDLYVFGLDAKETESCVAMLNKEFKKNQITCTAPTLLNEEASYQELGEEDVESYMYYFCRVPLLIVLAIAGFDGVKTVRRRIKDFAVFVACGMRKGKILAASALESLLCYAAIVGVGIAISAYLAQVTSGIWVPPSVYPQVIASVSAFFLLAIVLRLGLLAYSLRPSSLYASLTEE